MNSSRKRNNLFLYCFELIFTLILFCVFMTNVKAVDYISKSADSILHFGIYDDTIEDNKFYSVAINGKTYKIHTYVYDGNQRWTENKTFGSADDIGASGVYAQHMVMVIVKGNLTITKGVTVQPTYSAYGGPKGFTLIVLGDLVLEGDENSKAVINNNHGAYAAGEDVYLWKNANGSYETVPAAGAGGGGAVSTSGKIVYIAGNAGGAGSGRKTGGGGSGAAVKGNNTGTAKSGAGAAGTSYSGGSGGGGGGTTKGNVTGGSAAANGGAGGYGSANSGSRDSGWSSHAAGGGAGNPGGNGATWYTKDNKNPLVSARADGTGGLLTIYAELIENNGYIQANGTQGMYGYNQGYTEGGGGSGGGSVNIFTGLVKNNGSITATGGAGGPSSGRGGNGGNGTYTNTELILNSEFSSPTLKSLTVNKGAFSPVFDPETKTYYVTLDSEDSTVTISAQLTNDQNEITSGPGTYDIPAGTSEKTITVTSKIGYVSTYNIVFYRSPSPYKYLSDIKVDGVSISGFEPTKLIYNVPLTDSQEIINVEGIYGRPSQIISGDGEMEIGYGTTTKYIDVISEDGNYITTYTINFVKQSSSKLKSLALEKYTLDPEFDPEVLEYIINIPVSPLAVDVDAVPYDETSNVTITGNGYIKNGQNGLVTITVNNPNAAEPTTVYKVKVVREDAVEVKEYTFTCTGSYQRFEAPGSGNYRIELWGARGGYGKTHWTTKYRGGYGAYTAGTIWLNKGDVFYVYVGCAGSNASAQSRYVGGSGGWNGGAKGGDDSNHDSQPEPGGGGGGATDIRLVPTSGTTVWNEFDSLKSRVMVAAGGGGGNFSGVGGAGGTINGIAGYGSQSIATQTGGYGFGYGMAGGACTDGSGGAGAGWYGGYSYNGCGRGGGGGSSYISGGSGFVGIAEESVSGAIVSSGVSKHYSGVEFTDTVAYTGNQTMPSTSTGYMTGNNGNGYARITMLPMPSENNFLSSLTVKATDYETEEVEVKEYTPTYDRGTEDYYVTFDDMETLVTLVAKPDDSLATIEGLGTFDVPAGTTTYEIAVTAESKDVKVYKVHVTRPANDYEYPYNITISGLVPSLCSADEESYCHLNPEVFDKENNTYYLTVPSRIKQLWFNVDKGHPYQTVNGEGKVSLKGEDNLFTITVTSEDGSKSSVYYYNVYRDMTGNTDLSMLEIVSPLTKNGERMDISYDPDITEYYISVPNEYKYYQDNVANEIDEDALDKLQLYIETDDPNATYTVTGPEEFTVGMNQVLITVTAANGETKIYVLNVYRERNENVYLSNLQVFNGTTEYSLTPQFNKINLGTYYVLVPNSVSEVNIVATPEENTTTVSGDGNKTLPTGKTTYNILTTAENGTVETYKLTIEREKNSNAYLSDLIVKSGENTLTLDPTFDKETLQYTITVAEGTSTVELLPTPEVSTTKYKLLDNATIRVGNNTKRVMTIAEDGTSLTYNVTIIRPASSDHSLKSLQVYNDTTNFVYSPSFDPEVYEYTLEVDNDVTYVNVLGTKNNNLATITGNGKYNLTVGENEATITVKSEDGEVSSYMVKIVRKPNSNPYLKSISLSSGSLDPGFDREKISYTVNVDSETHSITINSLPEANTTTITGNGTFNLVTGNNEFTLVTLAEDKVATKTYTITIVKAESANNYLSNLVLKEGALSPKFDKNTLEYTAVVPYSKDSSTFIVTLEDSRSTYEVLPDNDLVVGDNEKIIKVIAQNGDEKEYKVNITRLDEETSRNTRLLELKTNVGTFDPTFDSETLYYEIELDYEYQSITVTAKTEVEYSSITGLGTYTLSVGENPIVVKVTSSEGNTRDYQIVVTRKKNTDARLSQLALSEATLTPVFDKDVYEYETSTNEKQLEFTTIVPYDSNATYQILGNNFSVVGLYETIIRVTAADGVTQKDYKISVNKLPSDNNNLEVLKVTGYNITPNYSKATTLYYLTVPNDVNSINIEAIPEDSNASVTGDGFQNLSVGPNYLTLEVTSESGKVKTYTIVVTKEGSSNNRLDKLEVLNGTIDAEYSNDVSTYNVEIPYEEDMLDLDIVLEDENATYSVSGNNNLPVGNSKVYVNVTAENGTVRTITLNVTRKDIISALLKDLKASNYLLSPSFNSYVNEYDIVVNNETTSLNLTVVPLDKNATYVVNGNQDFVVGSNVITIDVTSSDGNQTETYKINVTRQPYANTYLDYLYTSEGDVTPKFVKETISYSINVGHDTTSIELFGEPVDKSMTVTTIYNGVTKTIAKGEPSLGEFDLVTGTNTVYIKLTSISGVSRTYIVDINRAKDTANYLLSLEAKVGSTKYDLDPVFDSDVNSYEVTVPAGTTQITFNGTVSPNATVTGLNTYDLKPGDNTFKIVVKSESGVENEYTIVVHRELSTNNFLTDLIPSIGTLEPAFSYYGTEYTLNLDSSAAILSFEYMKEDIGATVSGTETQVIPNGTSTRTVVVTAENGDERTYTITVNKERTDIATLSNLYVTGYDFIDEDETKVYFDPDVHDYYISVPNSKKTLLASEVIATTTDKNAKITKSGNITLVTTSDNIYTVTVTAPDGFTKETYKIHVTRGKNNNALLNSLSINDGYGYLTTTFNPNVTEYTWLIPKGIVLSENSVTAVAADQNATIQKTSYLMYTQTGENTYDVKVVSEDGSTSITYKLHVELDLSTDATLYSLTIDKGFYEPTFDPETYTYNAYEYVDVDEVTVDALTSNENSVIISGTGVVALNDVKTVNEIIVEAEDGTQETYTLNIYKTILRDETLDNLGLNGLEGLQCINDKCVLSPSFNSDVVSYKIKVPYEYVDLDVLYETKNDQQTVKLKIRDNYITNYQLPVGKTTVLVEVYDGMNKHTKTYELEVERCKSNNTYLKSLALEGYNLDPDFDKTIQEYTIEVPYSQGDFTLEDFTAIPEFAESRVSINGYTYLAEGNNDVEIVVSAPDGSTREYIIHIIKASEYNSKLKNITVSTGVFWELKPKFKPSTYEYTVTIPGQYSKATVEAVAQEPETTITGTGEYELVTGNNQVVLVGEAVNGQKSTYIVNIIKEANVDVDLISLIVEEGDISPKFDRSTTKYEVNAPEDADKLTIHATPSSKESIVTITGNNNLKSGKNVINIIVQNKDKTRSKTYKLTVYKELSSNNRLSYIKVFDDDDNNYPLDPVFKDDIGYYMVEIPENVDKVTVDAKAQSEYASIAGLGEEYLNYGDNIKALLITAENGNVNSYQINLHRNYNLNLKLLESDKGELDPEFDPSVTEYVIELDKDQTEITFVAKPESNKVTVSGSGTYNLVPGDNEIQFIVSDPDGNEKVYTVNVKRAKDDNNYIKELSVDGILTPVFEKTALEYTLDVHKEVKSLDLTYTLESPVATSRVIGNQNFVFGEGNEVIIEVTAENGDIREYKFVVTPRPDEFFSNRLLDLTVSAGQLTPDFNPDINYYAVTVPNSTEELTITTLKENEYATVSIGGVAGGTRKVNLNVGRNVFPVVVTSQDGVSVNTYNVVVYRAENNDATLQSLIINGVDFHPIFAKTTTQYSAEIGSEINELDIIAIPTDANSKVEISGYKNLVAGENIVTIKVTAPDGVTVMKYQIKVTKSLSKNNYISSLSVSGYTFDKTYTKLDQGPYTINVESEVNSVMINAIPEVDTTTITGDGKVNVSKGRNVLSVVAKAESGDERTYTIIVNRAYSNDSTLKNILVSDGDLDPEFNPETLEYDVEVEEEVEEITITGILNDAAANITGNGTYDLTDGDIEVPLVVTAEDGVTKTTYKVKVHRVIVASSYLKSLVVQDGELYPNFHKLITSYTVLVPNEVRSLNMSYLPEDEEATVEVTGNESFKVGTNKVRISVTAKDNSSTTVYEISVVRQSKAANYLRDLQVNSSDDMIKYPLVPSFDKTTMYYEVMVGSDVEIVNIFAEAEDASATIDATDLGLKSVNTGENRFYITVESLSGAIRTYQIVVTRIPSSDNKLLSLTSDIGEWDAEFDPDCNYYEITVPIGTTKITLDGTASETSILNGLGTSDVTVGDNTRTITVTGEDGDVNSYTIVIKRPANNNVNLTKLIPSVGTLSPSYDNNELNYTIVVPDTTNVISFEAEPEDANATVTGIDITNIGYGENEITIVVTAEDKVTTKTIKVKVSKGKALEKILVNPTSVMLGEGEIETISYVLEPVDTTYTGVEWVSEDETVATVSNGIITGVKYGSTVVKLVSNHDNTIYGTVTVNVINKRIISSVYEIYRFTDEEKNAAVENEEDRKVDYTVGAEPETTIESFIKNFDNNETTLRIFDKDDNEIYNKEDIVGTGMKIKLIIDGVVYDTLEIAVKGDLDGDGIVAMPDYASLKNRLLETEQYNFIKVKASDFDNDDILAMSDYNTLKNYLLGLSETLNKPRE